jgi:broad specificity phosphatase PhoE
MTTLILIRHGETTKNISDRLHRDKDPEPLNERGRIQMKATALALQKLNPSIVYASTEKRALESAAILSQKLSVPLENINGLQERNWGIFSDKPWSEVKAVLDKMSLEERYNYIPPGGESWKQFQERLVSAINKALEENKNKTVIIVSHGGAIRALMPYLLEVPREESFKYDPANASITVFDYNGGKFTARLVDDTSHLSQTSS